MQWPCAAYIYVYILFITRVQPRLRYHRLDLAPVQEMCCVGAPLTLVLTVVLTVTLTTPLTVS